MVAEISILEPRVLGATQEQNRPTTPRGLPAQPFGANLTDIHDGLSVEGAVIPAFLLIPPWCERTRERSFYREFGRHFVTSEPRRQGALARCLDDRLSSRHLLVAALAWGALRRHEEKMESAILLMAQRSFRGCSENATQFQRGRRGLRPLKCKPVTADGEPMAAQAGLGI